MDGLRQRHGHARRAPDLLLAFLQAVGRLRLVLPRQQGQQHVDQRAERLRQPLGPEQGTIGVVAVRVLAHRRGHDARQLAAALGIRDAVLQERSAAGHQEALELLLRRGVRVRAADQLGLVVGQRQPAQVVERLQRRECLGARTVR